MRLLPSDGIAASQCMGMDFLKPELMTHPQQGRTGCSVRNWAMEKEDDDGRRDGPLTKGRSDGVIRGRKKELP